MRVFVGKGRVRAIALVVALVVAQIATAAHVDFDDSHPADDICAVCAAVAGLGAGNVAAPPAVALVLGAPAPQAYVRAVPSSFHTSHRLARGPPQAS